MCAQSTISDFREFNLVSRYFAIILWREAKNIFRKNNGALKYTKSKKKLSFAIEKLDYILKLKLLYLIKMIAKMKSD